MRNEKGDLHWWIWGVNLAIFLVVQSILKGAFVGHMLHELDSINHEGAQLLWGVFVFTMAPVILQRGLTPYRAAGRAVGGALLYMLLAPVAINYGLNDAARFGLDVSGAVLYAAMMATAGAAVCAVAASEFVGLLGDGLAAELAKQEAARAKMALERAEQEAATA